MSFCTNASGYLAPEYAMRGHLTEKTDVYAFGIVALELVSGRKNSDVNLENEKKYFLEWVRPVAKKKKKKKNGYVLAC